MPPDFTTQLRRRLRELGCPSSQVRRLVQEVAEHREDLKQAAVSEGLSEAAAELRVNASLGDPLYLAEHQMLLLQRSSWCGRHFFISFCLLPLLAFPVLWALLLGLSLSLIFAVRYGWDKQKLHVAADNPVAFHHLAFALQCADYVAIALVTLLFCWLARRASVSFKWMLTACGICSLCASFIWVHLAPHNLALGVTWHPNWIRVAIPLLVAGAIFTVKRRIIHEIPTPCPEK